MFSWLKWRRQKLRFRRPNKRIHFFLITLAGLFLVTLGVVSAILLNDLPSPRKLQSADYPVSTQILDRNGILLYEIYADTRRTPIKLEDLPPYVMQASISIEDQDFYHHFGFSFQGIVRAFKSTVFQNKLQGGSTITQQLVKTALLTPERTLKRKVREAVLTIATEILYSKKQILEMYLNHIPYGGTAYGIEAAAQKYFGKSATKLTLGEATLLAGLPQAPSRYSPFVNPESARARQKEVLRRMVEDKYITETQMNEATASEIIYSPPTTDIKAPHFVFFIKDVLETKYGLRTVEQGGLRVTTTLDLALQEYVQASVSAEIDRLERQKVTNGAALVTNPGSGEILAMVGSRNYWNTKHDGQVNLTNRHRQPGSSIKPLNYVTALQTKKLTAASMLLDIPTCFTMPGQPPYCPKNYDGGFRGPVSFRNALANSYNIPAVKILAINELETLISTATAMGITTFTDPSRYGLALTLGGGEVTMLDMATAFGTIANQGVKVSLNPILKVVDYQGKVLEEYSPDNVKQALAEFFVDGHPAKPGDTMKGLTRVLDREPAYIVADIMADNQARSSAFGSNSQLRIPGHTVSVKTGTTNDLKDNWTIGFTPQYLVATWVGNNDSTPMSYVVSGVTGAAPIWNGIMTELVKNTKEVEIARPPNITELAVCSNSGVLPEQEAGCSLRKELFWNERLPDTRVMVTKKNIWIKKDTGLPAFFGSTVALPTEGETVDTSNLELQEHLVASDPFTEEFCLDCRVPEVAEGEKKHPYPTTTINILEFQYDSFLTTNPETSNN